MPKLTVTAAEFVQDQTAAIFLVALA